MTEPVSGRPNGAGTDENDLAQFGYDQRLKRTMSTFTSFCLAFSMIAITGTLSPLLQPVLSQIGGIAIWMWPLAFAGVVWIVLVFMHMAARIPVTGYAYQWTSRITNPYYGWVVAAIGIVTFTTGATSIGALLGSLIAPEIGLKGTDTEIMLLGAGLLTLGFIINVLGIKIATHFNNGVAISEIVITITFALLLLIGMALFFDGGEGFGVITNHGAGAVDGAHIPTVNYIFAATAPIFALLGWEASADLAEETVNPRKAAPKAMFRAVALSSLGGFIVMWIVVAAMKAPLAESITHPNLLFWVIDDRLGGFAAAIVKVVAFASLMGCIIANIAVATRLVFSVSRDRMLPFSPQLASVHPKLQTPVVASGVLWAITMIITVAGSGQIFRITAMAVVAYYLTYGTTVIGVIAGHLKGRIPEPGPGYFGLGRFLLPVCGVALLWCVGVCAAYLIPKENHYIIGYFGAALGLCALLTVYAWWAIRTGRASLPTTAFTESPPSIEPEPEPVRV